MEECYENLKSKGTVFSSPCMDLVSMIRLGYKFDTPSEPPPPDVDDDVRRREEEELQRVLELSMHDKGGRSQWESYSLASSSGAGGSGAGVSSQASSAAAGSSSSSRPGPSPSQQQPTYGGYVPSSATPAVSSVSTVVDTMPSPSTVSSATATSPSPVSTHSQDGGIPIVTRVRALHTFEPTESGELAFEKGDIIKVVDRNYKDWWRGQLKGRTGIFPVNYVVSGLPSSRSIPKGPISHLSGTVTGADRCRDCSRSGAGSFSVLPSSQCRPPADDAAQYGSGEGQSGRR